MWRVKTVTKFKNSFFPVLIYWNNNRIHLNILESRFGPPPSYEAAKSTIDEESKLGPHSDKLIAGTIDLWAPQTMMLKNGGIMKRRDKKAALNLLAGNTANKYSSMLLWSPWNELEEVNGEQGEVETEQQKQIRLSVFPKSMFPVQINEDESVDML